MSIDWILLALGLIVAVAFGLSKYYEKPGSDKDAKVWGWAIFASSLLMVISAMRLMHPSGQGNDEKNTRRLDTVLANQAQQISMIKELMSDHQDSTLLKWRHPDSLTVQVARSLEAIELALKVRRIVSGPNVERTQRIMDSVLYSWRFDLARTVMDSGVILLAMGKNTHAIACLARAISAASDEETRAKGFFFRGVAHHCRADRLSEKGDKAGAVGALSLAMSDYDSCRVLSPSNAFAVVYWGSAHGVRELLWEIGSIHPGSRL